MLQATVLGNGTYPGTLLHARSSSATAESTRVPSSSSSSKRPGSSPIRNFLTPAPLTPTQPAAIQFNSRIKSSANPHATTSCDEVLTWSTCNVTWSRGVQIVRRYSYKHEGENVAFALFALFRRGASSGSAESRGGLAQSGGPSRAPQEDSNMTESSLFGPFHKSQYATWGRPNLGNRGSGYSRYSDGYDSRGADEDTIERTLVVFLQTRAHVYFPSGDDIIVHLPFVVDTVWPLSSGGALIQRALESREIRAMAKKNGHHGRRIPGSDRRTQSLGAHADRTSTSVLDDLIELEDEMAPDLPRLYTFTDLFDELKVVVEARVEGGYNDGHSINPPRLIPSAPTLPIPPTQSILHVSQEPYPFVVAYDAGEHQIIFYRRARVAPAASLPEPPAPNRRHLRPEELLRPELVAPVPGNFVASSRRGVSQASVDRRLSAAATAAASANAPGDPLNWQRRRSRGRVSELDVSGPAELHAVLAPPSGPDSVVSNGTGAVSWSSSVGGVNDDRRLSSVVEDRRRLSSVSGSSFMRESVQEPFGKMALHVAAEKDLRETTMMMGLEREEPEIRSDLVLDRLWAWRPPGPVKPENIRVFISENRSASSVFINLHMSIASYPPTLFTFHVELSPSRTTPYTFHEFRAIQCLAAVAVSATRAEVLDTLILTLEGNVHLIPSPGREMALNIPLTHMTDGRDEVARKLATSLSMVLDSDRIGPSTDRRVVDLVDPCGPRVTLVYDDDERIRLSLDFVIPHSLARRSLEALSYALPRDEYADLSETFQTRLGHALSSSRAEPLVQWQVFADIVGTECGLVTARDNEVEASEELTEWAIQRDPILRRMAQRLLSASRYQTSRLVDTPRPSLNSPRVLLALHLVAQDCRLSSTGQRDLILIAPLLLQLAVSIGRTDWADYWRRLMPEADDRAAPPHVSPDTSFLDQFAEPPDVLDYLARTLTTQTKRFPSPQSVFNDDSPLGAPRPCRQTELVNDIYAHMTPTEGPAFNRAYAVVELMVSRGVDQAWLADLPYGAGLPMLEMIRSCQIRPPKNASHAMYMFINRADLAAQCESERGASALDLPMGADSTSDEVPTIGEIMATIDTDIKARNSYLSALPYVRFGQDRRLAEVERIMQTTSLRTIAVQDPKGASEQEIINYRQNVVNTIANRTLSITVSQGMFQYGSRSTTITDAWEIPLIELAVKVVPGNTIMKAQLHADGAEWPCFHNGVSAALSISADCKGIDSSWIIFNRPHTLCAEHAGFLLGLGLTGHLRSLLTYHAFPYLEPRHDLTSVGLLLGLGCSFAGSEDLLITKILSLHTHALLPSGSMELNPSPLVQSSSLVGLGLVYVGSKNLRMAEIVLAEIGRTEMGGVEGFNDYRETYSFSAAAAFGLIMLGRGGQASSEVERRILAQLIPCIHGDAPSLDSGKGKRKQTSIDSTVTAPGATLALGLMFLKTSRRDVADLLSMPQTPLALESVRPDQLLIRTLARALILWDDVRPAVNWVEAQLPGFIQTTHMDHRRTHEMEMNAELAYLNIVAGACLGMGLKFAGTANEAAHGAILFFFSVLGHAAAGPSMTYEGRIRRNAARQALNIVTIALAVVVSGTGEIKVLRVLRGSHGQEGSGVTYGSHMAMHMALGLLFLGRGYFTLGNSNLAIAAMAIAFFPRFGSSSAENKAYPQAFRHLWALAVEPRCLIARDVDTREAVFLPVKVKVRGRPSDVNLISPTLVAPFDTLLSIIIDSPRYWPITYDLSNVRDRESLIRTRTIWVKRKSGFVDYNRDPRGNRSLFVRAGTMSGFDVHYDLISPAGPLLLPVDEVRDLVITHSHHPFLISLSEQFTGTTPLEIFVRHILLECISLDKPEMVCIYLGIALGAAQKAKDSLLIEQLSQLTFLKRFYTPQSFERDFAPGNNDRRHPLPRQSFLTALSRRLGSSVSTAGTVDNQPEGLSEYLTSGKHVKPSSALASYLVRQRVPPLRVLEGLRALVQAAATTTPREVLEFKMRNVSIRYWLSVMAQYDEHRPTNSSATTPASDVIWKLESLHNAISIWAV